jgi:DNA-binding transcriptional ArsR family regulator
VGTYPFAVSVRLAPASRGARYEYEARFHDLPNPSCTVAVGQQARAAYVRAARRIFSDAPAAPVELDLEVSVPGSDVEQTGVSGRAVVEHAIVLRAASGVEVDRWRLRGESPIVGLGEEGIRRAFARAADEAASELERAVAGSAAVAAWLDARGIPRRPGPPPRPPSRPEEPRAPFVGFMDLGPGLLWGASVADVATMARGGISGRWFVAQATFEHWNAPFAASPPGGNLTGGAHFGVSSMGLDLGGVLRFGGSTEFRAGAGAHFLRGRADLRYLVNSSPSHTTIERSRAASSLFAAFQKTVGPWTGWAIRLRVALELRQRFGGRLPADGFGAALDTAGPSVGLVLGAELPFRRVPEAGRGPQGSAN